MHSLFGLRPRRKQSAAASPFQDVYVQDFQHQQYQYQQNPPNTRRGAAQRSMSDDEFDRGAVSDGDCDVLPYGAHAPLRSSKKHAPASRCVSQVVVPLTELDDEDAEFDPVVQTGRRRRRFVRSGLTTYEQCISRNAMGRRSNRLSGAQSPGFEMPSLAPPDPTRPKTRSRERSTLSSLSTAVSGVLHAKNTALTSVVDPSVAAPTREFVVAQSPEGHLFVAARLSTIPIRIVKDDSFIGHGREHGVLTAAAGATTSGNLFKHHRSTNPNRRSEMDFLYRRSISQASGMGRPKEAAHLDESTAGSSSTSAATVRTSLSASSGWRGSTSRTSLLSSLTSKGKKGKDPTNSRRRYNSSDNDAAPALLDDPTTVVKQDALPMLDVVDDDDDTMQKSDTLESSDAVLSSGSAVSTTSVSRPPADGRLTVDDLFGAGPADEAKPSSSDSQNGSLVRPSEDDASIKRIVEAACALTGENDKEEDDDSNYFCNSFLNVRDVDLLQRKRSQDEIPDSALEQDQDPVPDLLTLDDLETVDDRASRSSNISEFLGGFKSRNGRNSRTGRNSQRSGDFVSRAARSLRNSKKIAAAKASSELAFKLWEAQERIPVEFRDDGGELVKKRKSMAFHRDKHVRFNLNLKIREFEVESDVEDENDNDNGGTKNESTHDDDDDDDSDVNSEDDDEAREEEEAARKYFLGPDGAN